VDNHVRRRCDADAHPPAVDAADADDDFPGAFADDDFFALVSREN